MDRVLMVSGGKDSSVLIDYCLSHEIQIDRYFFGDTRLELPCVYEWLDYLEDRFKITIERSTPPKLFDELFYRKIGRGPYEGEIRGFPHVTLRGCWIRRDLKFKLKPPKDCEAVIGYCSDEAREMTGIKYLAPFVDAGITQRQVISYARREDLYPPIYSLLEKYGAKKPRSGCWLCPKCSLAWSRMIYYEYPDLWERLKALERDSPHSWKIEPIKDIECKLRHFGRPNEKKLTEVFT